MTGRALTVLLAAAACAEPGRLPAARFANAPVVAAVNDRRDVPVPPSTRVYNAVLYPYDGIFHRRLIRALELPRMQRAQGVNALDEVPDSTWFTNRIGARTLAPEEVRRGPLSEDSPELHRPWTVRSTKTGGTSPGFVIVDARKTKYLLKFDDPGAPELETGIDVIVNRLIWAAGYNVAEDQIVYLRDEDLVLAPDAVVKDSNGEPTGPLGREELARRLAQIDHDKEGRIRGLLSRWISGKTLGGHPGEGVRDDDPNDTIPHELRRDLRGAYPIFAWLDHVDVHEGNLVDSWVTDPADPKRHYVRHYLIDFGRALGAMAWFANDWRRGHTYIIDFPDMVRTLATFGLADRDWRHRPLEPALNVGAFEARTFDPGTWRPDYPSYLPLLRSDRLDRLWGARIVARFTRAQIAAAVDAARFSDPASAAYFVDTLVARQRATTAYWFAREAPLERFTAARAGDRIEICFDDLALATGDADPHTTSYALATYDWSGRPLERDLAVRASARACARIEGAPLADAGGYTIVRITTTRPGFTGETHVHVGREPGTSAPRVIGVWRP